MKTLILFAAILISSIASAQTAVYKVTGNGTEMYIGGTIHLLKKTDFPLSAAYDSAYKKADLVYFETDMSEMNAEKWQVQMMQNMMYQDERSLETELSKKAYKSLEKTCNANNIAIAALQKFKPSAAVLALTVVEMMKMGYVENGVDAHFENKAQKENKEIKYLESVAFQIDLMTKLGSENENKFVLSSIRDIENMEADFEIMKKAWLVGDEKNIQIEALEMKKEFPEMYKSLLTDRNNNWMKKIIPMMDTEEIELILVGALHLYGEFGLLTQLEAQGFNIKQLK